MAKIKGYCNTLAEICFKWILVYTIWITETRGMGTDTSHTVAGIREYCEFENMMATCASDEVVIMEYAVYGRMKLGRCVQADLGFVGCQSDVLDIADRMCSGRRSCEIPVPNRDMKNKQSCLSELTSYLTASYSCVKVLSIEPASCRTCDYVRVRDSHGVLASVVTKETSRCGSPDCPWQITVPSGQRINITIINFAWSMHRERPGGHHGAFPGQNCHHVLATVKENSNPIAKTICAGKEREIHAYTSQSNTVEIRTVGRMMGDNAMYFLVKYEAIGCVDPDPPVGGWFQRSDDKATLGCNDSSVTTDWTCRKDKWEGKTITCDGKSQPGVVGYVKVGGISLPFGLSVTVMVVLALFIGLVILTVGLIIVRRRRARRHVEEPIYQPPPYTAPNYRDPPPSYKSTRQMSQVKADGPREENGYTHIWQRPLPEKPEDSVNNTSSSTTNMPQLESPYVQEPGSVHYGYNSIASVPRSNKPKTKQHQQQQQRPRDCTFALIPTRDTSLSNRTPVQDTRYFQFDSERMSNHVSA